MKKFKFRLDTILKLKEKALDDKMLELARVTKVLNGEEQKLQQLVDTKAQTNNNLITIYEKSECLNLQEVQSHKDYLTQLAINIKNKEQLLIQIRCAVREKQKEVQEALKEKNILEKLKEKQSEKHYQEMTQKEMIELDDISISRYKVV